MKDTSQPPCDICLSDDHSGDMHREVSGGFARTGWKL